MSDEDEEQIIVVQEEPIVRVNNQSGSKYAKFSVNPDLNQTNSPRQRPTHNFIRQEIIDIDREIVLHPQNPLISNLAKCEQELQQRMYIDQFITRFTKNQNDAIQYLIDNGVIQDDNKSIAKVLLQTDGISKDALNKYFCKPVQKNQDVFEEFCAQLNLKGKGYLEAMRLLLKRFRLAGEAQMVDRVVKIFARVYHLQNPTIFESDEIPYVLAYSFIMLSTDAASTKILPKNKMTKEQFLKNNLPIFPSLKPSYFEEVYDSIARDPFQTTVDYLEQMYNRMTLCNEPLQGDQIKKTLQNAFDLMKGCNVVKFGRYGEPKVRKFFLSSDEKRICWRSIENDLEPARYVNMHDVHDIALGHNTTEIMQKNRIAEDFDMFCFSIITTYRSIDLRVSELEIKSKWINYLRAVIINRREIEAKRAEERQRRQENEEKRQEIWKNDILPYWGSHWDYKRNKPENFKKYINVKKEEAVQKAQNTANSGSVLASICSCLKKTMLLNPIQNRQQIQSNNQHYSNQSEINNEQNNIQQEQIVNGRKNKSLLLMILWKLGIPDFARSTLWPIVIGNNLKIREELYILYTKKSNIIQESIINDIRQVRSQYPFINDIKARELSNILHAFAIYRPDFGYLSDTIDLAVVLIKHLSEYNCFQALTNLLHQHHFLFVYQKDVRQIEWRIRFFEENLERILPLVFMHLKAIKCETSLYLMKWFLKIFINQFKFPMLSRLWDNFLLEGEIYLFKVGICYMKYFQIELKVSNLDEVLRILTNWQPDINEDYFFIQIDEIPIKDDVYNEFFEKQNKAMLNTEVHKSLLTL